MSANLVLGVSLLLAAATSFAGSAGGQFNVQITLNKPGAVAAPSSSAAASIRQSAGGWTPTCISETLSEQSNALVRVVCGSEQFVNIAPLPGKVFLGTHGGALRYYFGSGFAGRLADVGASAAHIPAGSAGNVTVLRIYNASGLDEPLQMLVSF